MVFARITDNMPEEAKLNNVYEEAAVNMTKTIDSRFQTSEFFRVLKSAQRIDFSDAYYMFLSKNAGLIETEELEVKGVSPLFTNLKYPR